jgi:C1A family cysteine protease
MFRNTLILALALLSGASASLFTNNTESMLQSFDSFKRDFAKSYASRAEDASRFEIFVENMKIADARNTAEQRAGGSARHGITRFSDLSQDEFAARYLNSVPVASRAEVDTTVKPLAPGATVSVDWTGTYTTPVKNQGYCGSCWAFSAVEQVESDTMRTLDTTYILAPQQVVSCDTSGEDEGCNGGFSEGAYDYIKSAGGIVQESDYPYSTASSQFGISGTCNTADTTDKVVTVDSYSTVSGESAMASYVGATGPLSVCLDASSWNSYTGGVMSVCGDDVDHCVQAVGLYTSAGYWVVRNSWGTTWGEDGFIYLKYGQNTCDITNDPTYTKVSLV